MKKTGAYFTVEAALVLPIVLAVILYTVYLLFFQYDRCLLEQNTGKLALRGCTLQIADGEELVRELTIQAREEDDRYIAWKQGNARIVIKGDLVSVKGSGRLIFPFRGLMPLSGGSTWSGECIYENNRIFPVRFIRNCRKIMGGK